MLQTGTLKIQVPLTTSWGGKLVTVMRVSNLTEEQAANEFAEYKAMNPGLQLHAMWTHTRVKFF